MGDVTGHAAELPAPVPLAGFLRRFRGGGGGVLEAVGDEGWESR